MKIKHLLYVVISIVMIWVVCNVESIGITVAQQNQIHVTTADDELNAVAPCSLREAVASVNQLQAIGGCSAGTGNNDVIVFSLPPNQSRIVLNTPSILGEILITRSVSIQGPASFTLTIEGGPSVFQRRRLLRVVQGVNMSIFDMTLKFSETSSFHPEPFGGHGGAIYNAGNLSISRVTFDSNVAQLRGGAIYNTGSMTIADSSFLSNGIIARGLDLNEFEFSGGAITNDSTLVAIISKTAHFATPSLMLRQAEK
jgi:CSLREA domain-containing protein